MLNQCSAACGYCGRCTAPWDDDAYDRDETPEERDARERRAALEHEQATFARLLDAIAMNVVGKPVEEIRAALGRVARDAARNPQMVKR